MMLGEMCGILLESGFWGVANPVKIGNPNVT